MTVEQEYRQFKYIQIILLFYTKDSLLTFFFTFTLLTLLYYLAYVILSSILNYLLLNSLITLPISFQDIFLLASE